MIFVLCLNETKSGHFADEKLKTIESIVNTELKVVAKWLNLNKLSLNAGKPELIIFHSHQHSLIDDEILTSKLAIWDKMTKMKLKTFSNWMAKTRVSVGDKVIELKEERQLFTLFLVIQQSRRDLCLNLQPLSGTMKWLLCHNPFLP